MDVWWSGEEGADAGGRVGTGRGKIEEGVVASVPEGIAGMFYEGFGGAPAGKELREGATALSESLELLRGHNSGGQGEKAGTRANALNVHADVAVVKSEAKKVAGVADIERLRSPGGFAVRTEGKAYLLRRHTRTAREFPPEEGADERKPRPARRSLLRLLIRQQRRILRGRRQLGKVVYQIIHQIRINSTACAFVSYTANEGCL